MYKEIKKYKALVSQSDENIPSVIILENSIGEIVWSRTSAGVYTATLENAFPTGKTYLLPYAYYNDSENSTGVMLLVNNESNCILESKLGGIQTDGMLSFTPIEILIYP